MLQWARIALCIPLFAVLLPSAEDNNEWLAYGHDPGGQRFSPLDLINRTNVDKLKVAWTFRTGEIYTPPHGKPPAFEATPLFIDGTLYLPTSFGRVIALDPVKGTQRWVYDSHIDKDAGYGDFATRGLATWKPKDGPRRIYIATIDAHLIALDSATGKPMADFGDNGVINLRAKLRIPVAQGRYADYEETSAPAIANQTIVVGSAIADNGSVSQPSGEVRGFDVKTGKLKWTWDPIPQDPKATGADSWKNGSAAQNGCGERLVEDCRRYEAKPGFRSDRKREPGLLRRRTARRQSVCEFRGGAQGRYRRASLVFPDCASRSLGLRCGDVTIAV